jgi:hypothetical protein
MPDRSPALDALIRDAEAAAADAAVVRARLMKIGAPERRRSRAQRRSIRLPSIHRGRLQMKAAAVTLVIAMIAIGVAWLRG